MRQPSDTKDKREAAQRRRYESPLRQQQTAQTRDSIIGAGAEIAHRLGSWDWRELTFKAVGEGAGVSERTVHRHFSNERQLRDAILQRLVEESGVTLAGLTLGDFAGVATRVYQYLSSFSNNTVAITDPSFAVLDQQRRAVLLDAVVQATNGWSDDDREIAAATLDMLWNPSLHERLNAAWQLDAERATRSISWVIGLVEQAIRNGHRPGSRN